MASSAWHVFEAVVGAVFIVLGVAVISGKTGQSSARARWRVPGLVGIADTAFGVMLLFYGLLSHHLWADLISVAACLVGATCTITWLVKLRTDQGRSASQ
jgi:uncharacterized membrane protein HdeD (DUF308 family)